MYVGMYTFVVVMLGGACNEMTAVLSMSDEASSSAAAEEAIAGAEAEEADSALGAHLPPPPPLDTSDYIQCPHCNRR